jgi:YesN/AraC family two-component response regulator
MIFFPLLLTVINVGLLYWISIRGLRQQNIPTLIELPDNNVLNTESNILISSNKEVDTDLFKKIENYILLEKIYIQPNLTIIDISKDINEHPKKISATINLGAEKNFKSYINSFRVAEAKKLLKQKESNYLSIEGIGIEVGFQSKSVFYEAFKKDTGTTPYMFKNQK